MFSKGEYGVIAAIIAVLTGLIVWAVIAGSSWTEACQNAGGTVVSEFIGFIPVTISDGKTTTIIMQPTYDDHCMVNGQEIEIS